MNLTLSRNLKASRSQNFLASWKWTVSYPSLLKSIYKKRFWLSFRVVMFLNSDIKVLEKPFFPHFLGDRVRYSSVRSEWLQGAVAATWKPFYPGRQMPCNSPSTNREDEFVLKKLWLQKTRFCSFPSLFIYLFIYYYYFSLFSFMTN